MSTERLEQQVAFALEIDRLKSVERQTFLLDWSRRENSAEHSWHLAVMALALQEHANDPVDIGHVLKLLLVHDLVEIDAGDTYVYGPDVAAQAERERRAAERIFGLLPAEQAALVRSWWEEFEAGETAEARFARALDRLQPLLHNYCTQGRSWRFHKVTPEQVRQRMQGIGAGSETLSALAAALIDDAVARGYFAQPGDETGPGDGTNAPASPPRLWPGARLGAAPGVAGAATIVFRTLEGYMQLEILQRSYPDADEPADRVWLSAVAVGEMPGFRINCPLYIWASDLAHFHRDIRALLAGVKQRAEFTPIEEGIYLAVEASGDGEYVLKAQVKNDMSTASAWLRLELTQADVQAAMMQLAEAMALYPIDG